MWTLAQRSRKNLPLYKQVIQLVEEYIDRGLLSGGQRLPAERELAAMLGINRTTVIHALEELAERGVLVRKRGSGTFVNPDKWGLQSRVVFTWQPALSLNARRPGEKEDYAAQVASLKKHCRTTANGPLLDLSSDHLPEDLLPTLSLPDVSWRELISAEQTTETGRHSNLSSSPDGARAAKSVKTDIPDKENVVLSKSCSAKHDDPSSAMLGYGPLRRTVQTFLHRFHGLDVPYEHILITSGTQQAIFLTTQCLLRPGDTVGVESPSYFYSLPVFQAAGLRLCALPMDDEGITLDGLDAQFLSKRLKMVFLNPIFHNPTGTVMSACRKKEVLEYCNTRRIPLFEDDAYSLLAFDPGLDTSPIKRLDHENRVMYSGSLSSFAGHGSRTGWMVAPEPVISTLAQVRSHMDSGLSVLPQVLAMQYLKHDFQAHRLTLWEMLAQRANGLCRCLRERYEDVLEFDTPRGGLYLYAYAKQPQEEEAVLARMLDDHIIVAPARRFGGPQGAFRCNFAMFVL